MTLGRFTSVRGNTLSLSFWGGATVIVIVVDAAAVPIAEAFVLSVLLGLMGAVVLSPIPAVLLLEAVLSAVFDIVHENQSKRIEDSRFGTVCCSFVSRARQRFLFVVGVARSLGKLL